MLLRVDHIDLAVRDVEATAKLFGTLGFEEVRRTEHHGLSVEMRLPGQNQVVFEFHAPREGQSPGVNHVAFLVDDCEATVERLKARGVEFETPVKFIPASGRTVCTLTESAGTRLQLAQ